MGTVAIGMIAVGAAPVDAANTQPTDIVIYGCTPAGITAAIEARHLDRTVTLICRDAHVGGMTTNGLGWADTGNHSAIGGMARQFYREVKAYYAARGMTTQTQAQTESHGDDLDAMWVFEPHVAEEIYERWLAAVGVVPVRGARLRRDGKGVAKRGGRLIALATTDARRFAGRVFIDASYEGDLMAEAGVTFATGRESNATYGETLNGIQIAQAIHHQFDRDVDPYVIPGDRQSGLLPRVERGPAGRDGDGDERIQAYTYRLCMTQVASRAAPFPKPANYDTRQYELLARYLDAGWRDLFAKYDPIPNGKTDTNNHGAFSFDDIGMNYDYPTGSDAQRARIAAEHRDYQQGLLWFMQNDPRSPADVRASLQKWGLCRDEFVDNGHWPREMYIREARRMVTDFVMTENHLRGLEPTPASIGLGSYNMDSHNVRRYVDARGFARNEGDVQVSPGRAYEIGYGAIVPRRAEAENLLVPVALAASHIAYGSIRMEPVFMILGQSAAAAATIALQDHEPVQQVPYSKLRARLLEAGQILEPNVVPLRPPSGGKGVGDYTLHDFAAKWMVQQDDVPELEHYRQANRALLAEGDRRKRVVFIGDSITELWKGLELNSNEASRWVNRGIGGSNTTQMLLRFEDDAVGLQPATVVIMGGTNDFRAYAGAPAAVVEGAIERIRRNVTAMADIASARGIEVVLCSIPPVGRELDRIARDPAGIARANTWLASFARDRGYRFVTYTAVLSDEHGFMKSELSGDGIHPNEAGYRGMMPLLQAALAQPVQSNPVGHF
jgi:lysophospholipase L1-like esterase